MLCAKCGTENEQGRKFCGECGKPLLLEYGEWLVAEGSAEEAKPLLDEAREVFERLNAALWLERLDKIVATVGV